MNTTQRIFIGIVAKAVGLVAAVIGTYLLSAWGLSFWLEWSEARAWALVAIMIGGFTVMGLRAAWDRAEYLALCRAEELFGPLKDTK
jgi:uncharacterized membrane protein YeaQ/YmgE (transglycosylase-associated protein family)